MDSEVEYERTSEHEGPPIEIAGMMLRVKNRLRRHEGWVNHMYRDVKGKVTVGVGFLLRRSDVVGYSWRSKATKRTVPLRDALADWDTVSRLPYGQNVKAAKFDNDTKVELSDATIGFVLAKKLVKLRDDLNDSFQDAGIEFDHLPVTVREAMFDLGWNLGANFINGEWRNLREAIDARDWETAADESHRKSPPTPETRNAEIRNLILQAVDGDDG
jgi:GH24 family phage-related lysozyme (muramidase)